ncbi:hypothetical protein VA7868_00069 [Vibrio aerogenes CECT 7868]|uniref:Lipoprotein n=1 Tax=Vibrio aerogenes CECT 7868 TaxID=1216006 RepID=A0A1M5UE33_9VIBR|nr:formylglycine-generating enzyme family protein [Vibrio aerogenes]SHH61086.1 hypothetical protein VA7868_00069 [Vibrio aerogenes CECT 7868]
MKLRWLSLCLLPLLAACNSSSDLSASSESVSQQQIDTIIKNIQTQHPKLDHQLQQQILDVAVRAIENMVFIKGGSFMMGDFHAPCNPKDVKRMDWTPEAKCLSSLTSKKTGADHLHKVTLDSYSLSKYETSMANFDTYLQTLGQPFDQYFVQWKVDGKPLKHTDTYYQKFYKRAQQKPTKVNGGPKQKIIVRG